MHIYIVICMELKENYKISYKGDDKMKRCYIIEMGGDKEVDEMLALELTDVDMARSWIQGSMKSDSEYYNCDINCLIIDLKYEQYDSTTNFYYKGLVYVEAKDIVNEEMSASDIDNVDTIIESNLSVVSKIVSQGKLKEVSE